jgi:hypothetical protein
MFGLNSLTHSKVIAFLICTKFTCDLIEACHLIHYNRRQTRKKMVPWVSKFLHLQFQPLGIMLQNYIYIHYTVQEKLIIMYWNCDFYSVCKLFTVEVWQRRKKLQSSVAETIERFCKICSQYSSFPMLSCFWHHDAWQTKYNKEKCSYN